MLWHISGAFIRCTVLLYIDTNTTVKLFWFIMNDGRSILTLFFLTVYAYYQLSASTFTVSLTDPTAFFTSLTFILCKMKVWCCPAVGTVCFLCWEMTGNVGLLQNGRKYGWALWGHVEKRRETELKVHSALRQKKGLYLSLSGRVC